MCWQESNAFFKFIAKTCGCPNSMKPTLCPSTSWASTCAVWKGFVVVNMSCGHLVFTSWLLDHTSLCHCKEASLWFIEWRKRRTTAFWKCVQHHLSSTSSLFQYGRWNCRLRIGIVCWCSMRMPPWQTWHVSLYKVAWPSRSCHKKSCDCPKSLFLTMISQIFKIVNSAVSALGMVAKVGFLGNAGHSVFLSGHICRHVLSKYYDHVHSM